MARAHFVKSARKDNPDHGIKKGDSYWWWAFRTAYSSVKRFSKTRPRPSQLTQSEYLSSFYGAQETVEDAVEEFGKGGCLDDLKAALEDAHQQIDDLRSDCEDKVSNMESAFPGGSPTIDLLQQRAEACESTADSIQSAIDELENIEEPEEEDEDKPFELGDLVNYHEWEYEVFKVDKDPTTGGQRISLRATDSDEGHTETIRLTPSMLKAGELERVKDEVDESWRENAENAVSGIEWTEE